MKDPADEIAGLNEDVRNRDFQFVGRYTGIPTAAW